MTNNTTQAYPIFPHSGHSIHLRRYKSIENIAKCSQILLFWNAVNDEVYAVNDEVTCLTTQTFGNDDILLLQ